MNVYSKDLSSVFCYPINFNLIGDKLTVKQTPILFENGAYFHIHEFLKNAEDNKFNKKTGLFLTSLLSAKEIFIDKETPKDKEPVISFSTPLIDPSSYVINQTSINNVLKLTKSNEKTYTKENTFTFTFDDENDAVFISYSNNSYLTYTEVGDLYFDNIISPPSIYQMFDYLISDNNIIFFTKISKFKNIIYFDTTTNVFKVITLPLSLNSQIPTNSIFYFTSYENKNILNDSVHNSYIARYESSPLLNQKDIIPTKESLKENYKQNYLSFFPYENLKFSETDVTFDLQIHGLKNYQTPEYNYSRGFNYIPNFKSIRRVYKNIFSGTNQFSNIRKEISTRPSNSFLFSTNNRKNTNSLFWIG